MSPFRDSADPRESSHDPPGPTAQWLILVPTQQEREYLELEPDFAVPVELCGFGIAAAALMAGRWIDRLRPDRVLLVGVAGTFDPAKVGTCACFRRVVVDGLGAQADGRLVSPREMGLPQLAQGGLNRGGEVFDSLRLATVSQCPNEEAVLTVCAASGSRQLADQRQKLYPGVVAEEMEGFGVALACHAADVPLTIVRGMSNRVGDRDFRNWRIKECMSEIRIIIDQLLPS